MNLGAFFPCGILMACKFFIGDGRALIWTGLATASLLQILMLMMITFFTDWKKRVGFVASKITYTYCFFYISFAYLNMLSS